jgi:alkaline phosphatase
MDRGLFHIFGPAARISRLTLLAFAIANLAGAAAQPAAAPPSNIALPKNIILLESDGTGFNAIVATGMYTGKLGKQIYDRPEWIKSFVSTYPLRTSDEPIAGARGLEQDPNTLYDPAKNWDTAPATTTTGRFADHFAGYAWTKRTAPDSANTMSAEVNGKKSYNAAINVDGNGTPLRTIAEIAHQAGKSVGAVTTVQFTDATPAAAGGAHNVARANHAAIAHEMLSAGTLSVIMGTGNPDYTNDGAMRNTPDYGWIGASDWSALKAGTSGFKFIEDKKDFDALASATNPPGKLVGIARSFDSTQFNRAGAKPASETPYETPRRDDVPSLKTIALGALNILGRNPNGIFLMIEGGAVDRAMHANNIGRMIEERIEFDETVEAVSAYLDANTNGNNWSNTLVMVTADHDHLLLGPDSDTVPYQDLVDKGKGRVPGYKWQHNGHSNQPVPIYARGIRAQLIAACAKRLDSYTDKEGRKFGRGAYLDQTDIFKVMSSASGCS